MDVLYFEDERLPYLGAVLGVLEAEGIVDAVGLGPDGERVCSRCQYREQDDRKERTIRKHKKCEKTKGTQRTLLPLIDITEADAGLEDLTVAGLYAGNDEGILGGVVVVAKAKCCALVGPAPADELVDLLAWARGCTFGSAWRRRIHREVSRSCLIEGYLCWK